MIFASQESPNSCCNPRNPPELPGQFGQPVDTAWTGLDVADLWQKSHNFRRSDITNRHTQRERVGERRRPDILACCYAACMCCIHMLCHVIVIVAHHITPRYRGTYQHWNVWARSRYKIREGEKWLAGESVMMRVRIMIKQWVVHGPVVPSSW